MLIFTLKKKLFSLQNIREQLKEENSDCATLMAIAKNLFNKCYNPKCKTDVQCSLQQGPQH